MPSIEAKAGWWLRNVSPLANHARFSKPALHKRSEKMSEISKKLPNTTTMMQHRRRDDTNQTRANTLQSLFYVNLFNWNRWRQRPAKKNFFKEFCWAIFRNHASSARKRNGWGLQITDLPFVLSSSQTVMDQISWWNSSNSHNTYDDFLHCLIQCGLPSSGQEASLTCLQEAHTSCFSQFQLLY